MEKCTLVTLGVSMDLMWCFEIQQDEICAICDMDWFVFCRQLHKVRAEKIISNQLWKCSWWAYWG